MFTQLVPSRSTSFVSLSVCLSATKCDHYICLNTKPSSPSSSIQKKSKWMIFHCQLKGTDKEGRGKQLCHRSLSLSLSLSIYLSFSVLCITQFIDDIFLQFLGQFRCVKYLGECHTSADRCGKDHCTAGLRFNQI